MTWKDFKAAIGANPNIKTSAAINRAIRQDCPGGDLTLDALETWHKIVHRRGWKNAQGGESESATAYRHIMEIVDAMEDHIRERYELPPRVEREDLRRR